VENSATGMYFHGALDKACSGYTPLCETSAGQYKAQPIHYGLLFAGLAGTGAVIPTTTSTSANIAAHTVRAADGKVRVVLVNLGAASLLRMTAPTLAATSGHQIQGRTVSADGSFTPAAATALTCTSGTCAVTLPPYSAALVTLP
jgi:hypothetical protein